MGRGRLLVGGAVAVLFLGATRLLSAAGNTDPRVTRGKYLVEQVAMYGDCHTPRDNRGQYDQARRLMGASLDFTPVHPVPGWGSLVPRIVGLPEWSRKAAVTFFETGSRPDGTRCGPPMPQYRLSAADAQATVAYLKSLSPAAK